MLSTWGLIFIPINSAVASGGKKRQKEKYENWDISRMKRALLLK